LYLAFAVLGGSNVSRKRNSILVTGGCGFIGSNLVARLLERDYRVRVLDNLSVGERKSIPTDIDLVVGDIRDKNLVSEAVAGMGSIVHLAAHTNVIESIEQPQLDFDVNVRGTFNLLQRSAESNVEKLVFASSNAAVGDQNPPITESTVPAPLSPYGASKLSSEALCLAFWGSYGLQTIALRFANVYGPRSSHKKSVVARFFREALSNQELTIYGDGNQTRDFVYVDDICQAVLLSIEADSVTGVFQIGTGVETKIIDLAEQIKKIAHLDSGIVFEQPRKGEIIRNYCCIEKAKQVLGFEPQVDLNAGLAETYEWFKNGTHINMDPNTKTGN
jgi:UDP-glucose 4-epimerase